MSSDRARSPSPPPYQPILPLSSEHDTLSRSSSFTVHVENVQKRPPSRLSTQPGWVPEICPPSPYPSRPATPYASGTAAVRPLDSKSSIHRTETILSFDSVPPQRDLHAASASPAPLLDEKSTASAGLDSSPHDKPQRGPLASLARMVIVFLLVFGVLSGATYGIFKLSKTSQSEYTASTTSVFQSASTAPSQGSIVRSSTLFSPSSASASSSSPASSNPSALSTSGGTTAPASSVAASAAATSSSSGDPSTTIRAASDTPTSASSSSTSTSVANPPAIGS
ncbi:hypothetical protein JCM10207_005062 [Rhodosporidiobolus poonsookiae]